MKSTTVRGTPTNHIGPTGAPVGNAEGRTPGVPADLSGTTVKDQFRGDGVGIDTRLPPGSGTPLVDREGNVDEARRVVSQGRYGVSPGAGGVDMNDPAANGSGVVFDGTNRVSDGYLPAGAATVDSPVPARAPRFDPKDILAENLAHLGKDQPETLVDGNLVEAGGVMSR